MIDGSDGEASCCSCSIGGGGDGRIGLVIRIIVVQGNGINFDDHKEEDEEVIYRSDGERPAAAPAQ